MLQGIVAFSPTCIVSHCHSAATDSHLCPNPTSQRKKKKKKALPVVGYLIDTEQLDCSLSTFIEGGSFLLHCIACKRTLSGERCFCAGRYCFEAKPAALTELEIQLYHLEPENEVIGLLYDHYGPQLKWLNWHLDKAFVQMCVIQFFFLVFYFIFSFFLKGKI